MKKNCLIHISDLHYRNGWPEGNDLILEKLLIDLKELAKNEEPYLVFSGDLTLSGESEQYNELERKLFVPLVEIGIDRSKIISVPGNHDVCRESLETDIIMQIGLLSSLTEEKVFNDQIDKYCDLTFHKKFKNYFNAEKKIASIGACQSNWLGEGTAISDDVGVFCMNSAICSFGGSQHPSTGQKINDQSNLIIDTRKINKWVQENNFKIRVLVLHHPISWLNEWSQSELSNMRAFASLRKEARISFSGEKNRMQLMRLAGMALAKHEFGVKHPNDKLVEKATKSLEGSEENVNAAQTESLT